MPRVAVESWSPIVVLNLVRTTDLLAGLPHSIATHRRIPSALLAERWSRLERPTFCYIFGYRTSVFDGTLGATHGVDIPFVFDTVDVDPLAGTDPARFDLAEQVRCAWVAFARYGTPFAPTLPQWPPFDLQRRATMWLGLPCRVIDDPERETRLFWDNAVGPAAT